MTRSYEDLIRRLENLAPAVETEEVGRFAADGRSYPMFVVRMGRPQTGKPGVMIAAGIHGDEPAGVEAAMRFLEAGARDRRLLSRFHFTVFPCNNPTGWERNTRENWQGIDLNRQFSTADPAAEVALIMRGLHGRCFDLVFEMHEDVDTAGLYLYEISDNPAQYVGERIIQAAASMGCPINRSRVIEHSRASGGIIRRRMIRFRKTRVPQAIYTYRTCGGHVITLEPPASVLPFEERVKIELMSLRIALDATRRVS